MAVQTSYAREHDPAYEGQIFGSIRDARSYVCEGTIAFGRAVIRGTAERSGKLANAAGDFMGVSVRALHLQANAAQSLEYEDGDEAAVLDRGDIWVVAQVAVTAGDPVFYSHGTGADPAGTFRNDADTANATAVTGATWETTAALGAIAKIRIPSPQQG